MTIGRYPENVFVGVYANDSADDHFHPHTTVVEGISMRTIAYNKKVGSFQNRDRDQLVKNAARVSKQLVSQKEISKPFVVNLKLWTRKYSLTANLINIGRHRLEKLFNVIPDAGTNIVQEYYSLFNNYKNNNNKHQSQNE